MNSNTIKLIAGGDLCPADHYFTIGHDFANPDLVEKALSIIAPLLKNSDLAIANIESPLSANSKEKYLFEKNVFRGHPDTASIIRSAGISHLNVANNHMLQHGTDAFKDTINILNKVGIKPVGLSENNNSISPVYFTANGLRLAIAGISLVHDPFLNNNCLYDHPEIPDVIEFVKQTSKHVDHIIISIHWGSEGPNIPSSFEVHLGRQLIDAGASVIIGHHPHIVRPVENWGNGLICYSLGNLLFNLEWYCPYSIGLLVEILLGPKGSLPIWKPHFTQYKKNMVRFVSKEINDIFLTQLNATALWIKYTENNIINETHDLMLYKVEKLLKLKKIAYFMRMFIKGDTRLKLHFILNKMIKRER